VTKKTHIIFNPYRSEGCILGFQQFWIVLVEKKSWTTIYNIKAQCPNGPSVPSSTTLAYIPISFFLLMLAIAQSFFYHVVEIFPIDAHKDRFKCKPTFKELGFMVPKSCLI